MRWLADELAKLNEVFGEQKVLEVYLSWSLEGRNLFNIMPKCMYQGAIAFHLDSRSLCRSLILELSHS